MPKSSRRNALIAMLVLSLIWSYNWIVMKKVLAFAGPFEFSALRYALGSVVLFAALALRRLPLAPPPLLPTALIGLAQTLGFQALVQWALVAGGAGKTALFAYTMPFWVVLLAWLVLAERPGSRQWLCLGIAAGGLLLILEPWRGVGSPLSSLLALGGGLSWALGVVLSKRMFQRGGVSALSLTAWQMAIGALALVVVAFCTEEKPIEWSGYFVAALGYNAVLSSGLAWLLWSYVVETLPADVAGLSSLIIPVATVGFAWATLGEAPSPVESIGIALIAVALIVVTRRAARSAPR